MRDSENGKRAMYFFFGFILAYVCVNMFEVLCKQTIREKAQEREREKDE